MPETLTVEQVQVAIDMAAHPHDLYDQKGRVWSRWHTAIPGDYRLCSKCGRRIDRGYVLQPQLIATLCAAHITRRWI
jgi:hypothetical protein